MSSTTEAPRNNGKRTGRGKPPVEHQFKPGNPGRPKGARNKATLAMEALLEGEANNLTRKAVEMALQGDTTALRLCMERLLPARKDRHVSFALPKLKTAADAVKASVALVEAVASGDLTPSEAAELSKLIDGFTRAVEVHEFEERLAKLEEANR